MMRKRRRPTVRLVERLEREIERLVALNKTITDENTAIRGRLFNLSRRVRNLIEDAREVTEIVEAVHELDAITPKGRF